MSDEIDPDVVEQIKASAKLRGPIEKVVLSADGKLIDGHQRKAADPDWPEEINPKLKTEKDCVLFDIDKNWNRTTKSETWKRSRIEKLCRLGLSVQEINRETGLPDRTIYRYMPVEFKNPVKAEAGRVGGPEASVARVATQLLKLDEAEEKARAVLTDCFNCKMATREDQLKTIDGKRYCPRCAPFVRPAKPKEESEKPVSPREVSTWEHRESERHVLHSKEEMEFVKLAEDNRKFGPVVQDRTFYAMPSIPDAYFPKLNWIVYVDGPPHKGREDLDEKLRSMIGRTNKLQVFVFNIGKGKPRDWIKTLENQVPEDSMDSENTLLGASDNKEASD